MAVERGIEQWGESLLVLLVDPMNNFLPLVLFVQFFALLDLSLDETGRMVNINFHHIHLLIEAHRMQDIA